MPTDAWQTAERLGAVVHRIPDPGPGEPLAVKELIAVRGVRRTASSGTDDPDAPPERRDAGAVALLRAGGWAPVAATRTHEHAWGITTRSPDGTGTANPHDPRRVTGGSSGGSAVAVAVGAVALALGSDTAGSVRIPAAWCGAVGLKPTFGAVPVDGVQPLAPSLDVVGLLSADLGTCARGAAALGLPVEHAGTVRVGAGTLVGAPAVREDLAEVLERAVRRLEPQAEVALPDAYPLFREVQPREALRVHVELLRTWPSRRDAYGDDVRKRLELAEQLPPLDVRDVRARLRDAYLSAMADVDVVALPVAACGPSTVGRPDVGEGADGTAPLRELVLPFTTPASLLGLPALSVPVGVDRDGLPVGLQLVGHPGGEAALLAAARALSPT